MGGECASQRADSSPRPLLSTWKRDGLCSIVSCVSCTVFATQVLLADGFRTHTGQPCVSSPHHTAVFVTLCSCAGCLLLRPRPGDAWVDCRSVGPSGRPIPGEVGAVDATALRWVSSGDLQGD